MSVSTTISSYPGDSQWEPVTSNTNSLNETRFLVGEIQPYRLTPVNYNGASGIYNAPKLPNVNNANCINSHNLYLNTPNYVNTATHNGLSNQEMRFQKAYNGLHNPVMVPNLRHGHVVSSVNTWSIPPASGDRVASRPTWNVSKPTSGGVKKPKRIRTAFTSQQMMELENEYARTRYLDRSRRIELSEILHLNERTIKIWFQNRRMKEKKDRAENLEDTEATSTTELLPDNGPVQMVMYEPYTHNTVGRLERGDFVEQFQPVVAAAPMPMQNMGASMMVGSHDVKYYPTFMLDNTSQLPQQFQQDTVPLPSHCQQLKEQYPMHNTKNVMNEFKAEIIENSSNVSESSTNDAFKTEEERDWDLSWIRSIHIEEELHE